MKIEVNQFIKEKYQDGQKLSRTDSVIKFASDFNTTVVTVYRWIKKGQHFVINGEVFEKVK